MIRYLKRKDIDIAKYNDCIENATNTRIYAYSWYLDIVADNWGVLVLDDYKAVMPLPWRQKYLIKYIYLPAWTQQLGVFSGFEIDASLVEKFVNSVPKKFKKIAIQFNSKNDLSLFNTKERKNYILPLNKPYEEIYKEFNKNRKRSLNKIRIEDFYVDKEVTTNDFLNFYLNQPKNYQLNQNQITTINILLNSKQKTIHIWGIRENKEMIASLVWLKDFNRITYLLPIATKQAKQGGLPTLLVSLLIKEYQKSNLTLDFEGSMLEGVASFYRGFGAEAETYCHYLEKVRLF